MNKRSLISTIISCLIFNLLGTVSSVGQDSRAIAEQSLTACTRYPDNPERDLANRVIEIVRKTSASEDDPLLREVKKLETPEGQKELRKYLEENIEKGSEAERTYKYCLLIKQLNNAFNENNQQQKMRPSLLSNPPPTTKKCPVFFCNWRLCKC